MGDMLIMSKKERNRKALLEQVVGGYLTLVEAAPKMGVCYRQAKRIWSSYQKDGDAILVHKLRGKASPRAYDASYREAVIKAYKEHYLTFGPTLASEHLRRSEGFTMSTETLRQWLLAEGLWSRHRRRKSYRTHRERRSCFGDLVQIDGSIHEWFIGSGNKQCLLNMVDDATGKCYAQLDTGETKEILLRCLYNWIKRYGIPKAVYVDLKSVYISPSTLKDSESSQCSVFQQVCKRLNIEVIKAYSPQAKGRVERKHGVFQDRFVKELKLNNIRDIAAANTYLETQFLPEINRKYAKKAKCGSDAHRPSSSYGNPYKLIYEYYERQVQNDWTVQLDNTYYQLEKGVPLKVRAKQKVEIRKHIDGDVSIWYRDVSIKYTQLQEKPKPEVKPVEKSKESTAARSARATAARSKTSWGTEQDWLWKSRSKNKKLARG